MMIAGVTRTHFFKPNSRGEDQRGPERVRQNVWATETAQKAGSRTTNYDLPMDTVVDKFSAFYVDNWAPTSLSDTRNVKYCRPT
jgi:hypothetical protein